MADSRTPLLNDGVSGSVDYRGRPSRRSRSGRWRSAWFIIGVEMAERFGYFGVSSNLINYLTGQLGQPMVTAAENVNIWCGTALMLPLLGAALADSFTGRYRTILIASSLYILGLGLLTLSTMLSTPTALPKVIFFFVSLYLVAFAQGGQKPCVQAFGADQFDGENAEECLAKNCFFNWCYFASNAGTFIALLLLTYIQDNLSWSLGFAIPCVSLVVALFLFFLGTPTYRFPTVTDDRGKPVTRVFWVFINAALNRSAVEGLDDVVLDEGQGASQPLRFLNKALIASKEDGRKACTISEVEEAKRVLKLIPIWGTSLPYAIVLSQCSTFFTKQATTMDRSLTSSFQIPAASVQSLASLAVFVFLPIYDRTLVPLARSLTLKPAGISPLQRIGVGMLLSTASMAVAAAVETKRLRERGPLPVWWLVPQLVLVGVSTVFAIVGLQEFFYDEVSRPMKSVGAALCMSIFGVGSFLSGFLISAIEGVSVGYGGESWFGDDMNKAHLDYFYWFLAGLSEVGLVAFLYFANSYLYRYNEESSLV